MFKSSLTKSLLNRATSSTVIPIIAKQILIKSYSTITSSSLNSTNSHDLSTLDHSKSILDSIPHINNQHTLTLYLETLNNISPTQILTNAELLGSILSFLISYDTVINRKYLSTSLIHETSNYFSKIHAVDKGRSLLIELQRIVHTHELKNGLLEAWLIQGFLQHGLLLKAYDQAINSKSRLLNTTLELLLYHLSSHGLAIQASSVLELIIKEKHPVYPRTLSRFSEMIIENKEDQIIKKWWPYLVKSTRLTQDQLLCIAESLLRLQKPVIIPNKHTPTQIMDKEPTTYIRELRSLQAISKSSPQTYTTEIKRRYTHILIEMKAKSRGFNRAFDHLVQKFTPEMNLSVFEYPELTNRVRVSKNSANIITSLKKRCDYDQPWEIKALYMNMILWRLVQGEKHGKLLTEVIKGVNEHGKLRGLMSQESLRVILSSPSITETDSDLNLSIIEFIMNDTRRKLTTRLPPDLKYQLMKRIIEDTKYWVYSFKVMEHIGYRFQSFNQQLSPIEVDLKDKLIERCQWMGYDDKVRELVDNFKRV
ncbi:hypothetical protein WICPIJ_001778 [Wickerhamomyces pijperi]|uniref:Uncharacterized protein n=1 Tax=Wickerhamomyces pijperi TaxID=599730 RepID=A0A9P8QD08_WICPI|nr:hypothetical protein WICPIJ_001778 [Wickerhamomyces pijperi]